MSIRTPHHPTPDLLIRSKLYRPRMHPDVLPRSQLIRWLNMESGHKVTLISAPAGMGKTTLLSIWLEEHASTVSWFSLDEADSNFLVFLKYIAAALQIDAQLAHSAADIENFATSPRYCAQYLANEMAQLSGEHILVLDDYHEIAEDSPVHQAVAILIEYLPPHIHMVIASRRDPPWPLAQMRARRYLRELRMKDLVFSRAEVQAHLNHVLDTEVDASIATVLYERAQGWPAVVHLAVLSLQRQSDPSDFLTGFSLNSGLVTDYLTDEILERLPVATQHFLMQISIFERCCAPLCAAVTGVPVSECREILNWLAGHNFFTTVIDAQNHWYRFHDLFRELLHFRLRKQTSPQQIAELHQAAYVWLAQHDQLEEAVYHALAAHDDEGAVSLVEEHKHALLEKEQFAVLEHLMQLLPNQLIDQRPQLLLTRALLLAFRNADGEQIAPYLHAAEKLLEQHAGTLDEAERLALKGEIHALYSLIYVHSGDGERSLHHARLAHMYVPQMHTYMRGIALFYLGDAYQLTGNTTEALQTLQNELKTLRAEEISVQMRIRLSLGQIYLVNGELYQAAQAFQQLLKMAQSHSQSVSMGWAHFGLGLLHYEWDKLDAAAEHFQAGIGLKHQVRVDTLARCYFGLVRVRQAQQQSQDADALMEELLDILLQKQNAALMREFEELRARLLLMRGELAPANSWARTTAIPSPRQRTAIAYPPALTHAHLLYGQGTATSLQKAATILQDFLDAQRKIHDTRRVIKTLALQALVYAKQGAESDAHDALVEAITLGQRGGFMRTFLNLGTPMASLLYSLLQSATLSTELHHYVQSILVAFPAQAAHRSTKESKPLVQGNLVEPLTNRELEVLALLQERLTNDEIAQRLVISPRTVKKHTSNIYQKLQTSGRRHAVAKAKALGLLAQSPPMTQN